MTLLEAGRVLSSSIILGEPQILAQREESILREFGIEHHGL